MNIYYYALDSSLPVMKNGTFHVVKAGRVYVIHPDNETRFRKAYGGRNSDVRKVKIPKSTPRHDPGPALFGKVFEALKDALK